MTRTFIAGALGALFLCAAGPAMAADLPDPSTTPGQTRPGITAADLCPVAHTPALRHVTAAEKRKVFAEYGVAHPKPGAWEVDHLISLELGGTNDVSNLWPQSYISEPWNAHLKDRLENYLHREVCAGRLSLATAQHEIATDWIGAYRRYIGEP